MMSKADDLKKRVFSSTLPPPKFHALAKLAKKKGKAEQKSQLGNKKREAGKPTADKNSTTLKKGTKRGKKAAAVSERNPAKKPRKSSGAKDLVSRKVSMQPIDEPKFDLDSIAGRLLQEKYQKRKGVFVSASLDRVSKAKVKQAKGTNLDLEQMRVEQMWHKAKRELSQASKSKKNGMAQFEALYEISKDEVLGSGQFGTVFLGIHRETKRELAIKEIIVKSNSRAKRGESTVFETLRAEVAILQAVNHPGIIALESMFETSGRILVVLEKMNGDMLEKILAQPNGRLPESKTKFLMCQILSAVQYLHSFGIAHCDLKPENVLLSNFDADFPQTKLCDFGYARFIRDNQKKRVVVGTQAYLAPEVMNRKGYNKSVDIWSIGVIIYVSLSGTFPFNEGLAIESQLKNTEQLFPRGTWGTVSAESVNLIQKLLTVQIKHRPTIEDCMRHKWFHDAEVHAELCNLEERLGVGRYLTSEGDDVKFAGKAWRKKESAR